MWRAAIGESLEKERCGDCGPWDLGAILDQSGSWAQHPLSLAASFTLMHLLTACSSSRYHNRTIAIIIKES
jgi:cyanate permease